jgi:hypothetical protein
MAPASPAFEGTPWMLNTNPPKQLQDDSGNLMWVEPPRPAVPSQQARDAQGNLPWVEPPRDAVPPNPTPADLIAAPVPQGFHRPKWDGSSWVEGMDAAVIKETVQGQRWESIKAMRDTRKAGGVKVGDKWFHSDDASRIQQLGLVMMGAGMPAGIQWKTMDGSFIAMTPTLATQVFQASAASDMAIFSVAEQHRASMMAAPDPAAYDFSAGWPLIYGE